jgi:hypothetical protein
MTHLQDIQQFKAKSLKIELPMHELRGRHGFDVDYKASRAYRGPVIS